MSSVSWEIAVAYRICYKTEKEAYNIAKETYKIQKETYKIEKETWLVTLDIYSYIHM